MYWLDLISFALIDICCLYCTLINLDFLCMRIRMHRMRIFHYFYYFIRKKNVMTKVHISGARDLWMDLHMTLWYPRSSPTSGLVVSLNYISHYTVHKLVNIEYFDNSLALIALISHFFDMKVGRFLYKTQIVYCWRVDIVVTLRKGKQLQTRVSELASA